MRKGKQVGRVAALALLVLAVFAASTCDDPTGVQVDITGISTTVNGHFHRCTIPGRDITMATPGNHTYTSTTDAGHYHLVVLSSQNLLDLQQPNAAVSVGSTLDDTGHSHSFLFQH